MGGISIVGALIKVVVVFALLWVTLKVVARVHKGGGAVARPGRAGHPARPAGRLVEVMARSPLGRNSSVVVVRIGDTCLALGVSDQRVNLLSELDLDLEDDVDEPVDLTDSSAAPARTQDAAARPAWKDFVENLRERTVRH